ncbi:hypothetical protein FACS1894187_19280 [Synergistales bacterium]|nr:hypothetical protein FACS1894187_19280 [Synergistales bacterium]
MNINDTYDMAIKARRVMDSIESDIGYDAAQRDLRYKAMKIEYHKYLRKHIHFIDQAEKRKRRVKRAKKCSIDHL